VKWKIELTRVLVKRLSCEIIIEKNLGSHSVLSEYHWGNQESRSRRASHANLVTLRLRGLTSASRRPLTIPKTAGRPEEAERVSSSIFCPTDLRIRVADPLPYVLRRAIVKNS